MRNTKGFLIIMAAVAALFFGGGGCAHKLSKSVPVTAGARASVGQATTATAEASRASERSSAHIRTFRTRAERIAHKATQALRYFDADGKPERRP